MNWSADFPTVAGVAESLYQLDTGTPVDGVVAFDVEAVRRMIGALEPLQLQGYQEAVTAANLAAAMQAVWEAPAAAKSALQDMDPSQSDWWQHRKDFMGDLAQAGQAKIEGGQADLVALAQAVYSDVARKTHSHQSERFGRYGTSGRTGLDGSGATGRRRIIDGG